MYCVCTPFTDSIWNWPEKLNSNIFWFVSMKWFKPLLPYYTGIAFNSEIRYRLLGLPWKIFSLFFFFFSSFRSGWIQIEREAFHGEQVFNFELFRFFQFEYLLIVENYNRREPKYYLSNHIHAIHFRKAFMCRLSATVKWDSKRIFCHMIQILIFG